MRTQIFHFNEINDNRYSMMSESFRSAGDNRAERQRLSRILHKAMEGSLTKMQLTCLTAYAEGVPQKQIAAELHLSRSTVCRHIKAAKTKLRKITSYYS